MNIPEFAAEVLEAYRNLMDETAMAHKRFNERVSMARNGFVGPEPETNSVPMSKISADKD